MTDARVRLLAPLALRDVLSRMLSRLPLRVETKIMLNPEVPRRIADGQSFDVGITNPWYLRDLVAGGYLKGDSATEFGRIPLAVGALTALDGKADLVALLRDAGSVAYTADGTSGAVFLAALARMGLEMSDRLLPLAAGGPVRAVAAGEAALAVAPLTTLVATPGLRVVGRFPEGSGTDIPLSIFRSNAAGSAAVDLCQALLDSAQDAELAAAGLLRPG